MAKKQSRPDIDMMNPTHLKAENYWRGLTPIQRGVIIDAVKGHHEIGGLPRSMREANKLTLYYIIDNQLYEKSICGCNKRK